MRNAIERHRRGLDANPVAHLHERGPRLEAAVLGAAAAYLGASTTDIDHAVAAVRALAA